MRSRGDPVVSLGGEEGDGSIDAQWSPRGTAWRRTALPLTTLGHNQFGLVL